MATIKYDAFISYSQAADAALAPVLQSALHRFNKRWYQLRSMWIFRDKTSLSATPGLWGSIEAALGKSEHFILLASPRAADSTWVQKEVAFWKEHKSIDRLLIVLTDGQLHWDYAKGDFDWQRSDALPRSLENTFTSLPLYVDLTWARDRKELTPRNPKFRDAVADLASAILQRPKDVLIGEDIQEHKRTLRIAWLAGAVLFAMLIVAVYAGIRAEFSRRTAETNERVAQASIGDVAQMVDEAFQALDDDGLVSDPRLRSFRGKLVDSASERIQRVAEPLADSREIGSAVAEAYIQLAYRLHQVGDMGEAVDVYRLAVPALAKLVERYPESRDFALRLAFVDNNIGWVMGDMGRHDDALVAFEKATTRREAADKTWPNDPEVLRALTVSYSNIGLVMDELGRQDDALTFMQKDLQIRQALAQRTGDEKYRWYLLNESNSLNNLSNVHRKRGDLGEAVKCRERCLQIRSDLVASFQGEQDLFPLWEYLVPVAKAESSMGRILLEVGKSEEAHKHLLAADAAFERAIQQHGLDTGNAAKSHQILSDRASNLQSVGDLEVRRGDLEAARRSYRDAAEILEEIVQVNPEATPYLVSLAAMYGQLAAVQSDIVAATALTEKALDRARAASALGESVDVRMAVAQYCLKCAWLYGADVASYERAESSLSEAIESCRNLDDGAQTDPEVLSTSAAAHDALSRLKELTGQPVEAFELQLTASQLGRRAITAGAGRLPFRQALHGILRRLQQLCLANADSVQGEQLLNERRELWIGHLDELRRTAEERANLAQLLETGGSAVNSGLIRSEEHREELLSMFEDATSLHFVVTDWLEEPQRQYFAKDSRFAALLAAGGEASSPAGE